MGLTVNEIISSADFNSLVTAVKNECNRRHYNSALTAPSVGTKSSGDSITYSEVNALLASICGLDAFPGTLDSNTYIASNNAEQYVTLKNFQYDIIKALNAVSTTINTASQTTNIVNNTDCRGTCAGLCTGCVGTCVGTCLGSCEGSCKDTCSGSCSGGCSGCEGCGGCGSTCTGSCVGSCATGCGLFFPNPGGGGGSTCSAH